MAALERKPSKLSSRLKELPYPLCELENKPRSTFFKGEIGHYIFFWTCAGAISGLGLGFISFYRRHRYRTWITKQPKEIQLKLLQKNNMISNISTGPATTRFSTLPHSMDTRMKIPYSSEYRPYQWYEWGPLKLWNNLGHYPWASELFTEVGKWCIRLSLLCVTTLAFESSLCLLFGYPLGTNIYIRGTAGLSTGYIVAKIASEGVLFWYQSFGIAMGLGTLWALATFYNPNWGEIARENQFVIEMYSDGLHKTVKRYYKAKKLKQELYAKDMQQKHEIYDEFLQLKQEELSRKGRMNRNGGIITTEIENVDFLAASSTKQLEEHWIIKSLGWLVGKKKMEISQEIDEMPLEQRKKLEQEAIGDTLAINYNRWPFKGLAKQTPQWFALDKNRIRNQSDTAKLVHIMSTDDRKKPDPFDEAEQNKVNDLSILS